MRHHTLSDREALQRIRPRNRSAQRQLLWVAGFLTLAIIAVAPLVYVGKRIEQHRQQNWDSAVATIEDIRMKPAAISESNSGGAMLYDIEVLARFRNGGAINERWIRVDQRPESLAYAKLQSRLWAGKQFFVRWNPADSNQIDIDLH